MRKERQSTKLLLVATTPETFATILSGQPRYIGRFFQVSLCSSPEQLLDSVAASEQVSVYGVRMARGLTPFRDIVSIFHMLVLILKVRPDIVHSYTPKAGLVAMIAAWVARCDVRVHTFTGLVFPTATGIRRFILIWVDRLICALATTVVPESEGVRKDLVRTGITRKPLDVIGWGNIAGVDLAHFSPRGAADVEGRRLKYGGSAKTVFCFVGRLNKDKGLSELYAAFKSLEDVAVLVVVGALDETAPPEAGLLAALEKDPHVFMEGFQSDIRPFLAAADVLVLPSYREGFPNVVLQSLAMERPVIVTDVSGSNEITIDGVNGWVVPPKDVIGLRDAMKKAVDCSPDELEAMGQKGRALVAARHERGAHLQRMVEFYMSLIGDLKKDESTSAIE